MSHRYVVTVQDEEVEVVLPKSANVGPLRDMIASMVRRQLDFSEHGCFISVTMHKYDIGDE